MKDPKLTILGVLILIGGILFVISAFTPCWFVGSDDYYYSSSCSGSAFWAFGDYWEQLVGWIVVLCLALYFIVCFAYYKALRKIKKNGYCRRYKKWLGIISILSAVITFLIILLLCQHQALEMDIMKLGYSTWIAVASAVFTAGTLLLSTCLLFKQQWQSTPPIQTVQIVQHQQPQTIQMIQVTEPSGVAGAPQMYQMAPGTSQPAVNPAHAAPQMYQIVSPPGAPTAQPVIVPAASHVHEVSPATNPSAPTTVLTTSRPTSPIYQVVQAPATVVQAVQPVQPTVETIPVSQIYQASSSAPSAQPNQPVYVVYPQSS